MKLLESNNKVVRLDPVIQKHDYTIAQNAKVFSFFSDKLYKYKVLAVLRELSTNAQDESDKFEVHMPSVMNPVFWIRDYGPGMSPETVAKVYTVYGKSTKDESNDKTGCLGLGSKSPFCYHTKTFTVESYHNGKHYVYNCFIDEVGNPTCELVSEQSTTEPNGLKVIVPTNKNDTSDWLQAAQQVYSVFQNQPIFVGKNIPTINKVQYSLVVGNVKLDDSRKTGARIIMGSVAYPVSLPLSDKKYADLQSLPIDIFADVGDVSITISREELSYDPRTIAVIKGYFETFITNLKDKIEQEVKDAESLFDARKKYCIYVNSLRKIYGLFSSIKNVKWNGVDLFPGGTDIISFDPKTICVRLITFNAYSGGKFKINRSDYSQHDINKIYKSDIVFDDMSVGALTRAYTVVSDKANSEYSILLLRPYENVTHDTAKNSIIQTLGLKPTHKFKLSSELPATPKSGVSRVKASEIMKFEPVSRRVEDAWININQQNIPDNGIYVELSNRKLVNSKYSDVYELRNQLSTLRRYNITVGDIYGVKKTVIEDFKNDQSWIHLDLAIESAVQNVVNNQDYHDGYYFHTKAATMRTLYNFLKPIIGRLPNNNIANKLVNGYDKYTSLVNKHQQTIYAFDRVLASADKTLKKSKEITDILDCVDKMTTLWPLLNIFQTQNPVAYGVTATNAVVDYLNKSGV